MKRLFFSIFIIVLLSSCYHEVKNKTVVPARLLSEDSIVIVLTEIQLAEGAITLKRFSHQLTDIEKKEYYGYVYHKFDLTPELLKENVDYYNSDPDRMIAIYDKVLENLSKIQGEITIEQKQIKKINEDSLKAIDTTAYVRKIIPVVEDLKEKSLPW